MQQLLEAEYHPSATRDIRELPFNQNCEIARQYRIAESYHQIAEEEVAKLQQQILDHCSQKVTS